MFYFIVVREDIDIFFDKNLNNYISSYNYWSEQYLYIFYYMVVSLILCFVLFFVAFILSPKEVTFEKSSSYECGFEPFGDGHSVFNVQFFIVGILFMIFDLELAFLFPWVLSVGNLNFFGFFVMIFFLVLLTVGLIYEWQKGALDWI